MAAFDWSALPVAAAPSPAFDWNAHPATQAEEPSEIESGLRGAAQGATFGSADEIGGALEAAYDKVRGAHEDLGKLYAKHRDESRAAFKRAEDANPLTYGAGQLVGGVAANSALALATGGASIPEQIALGAAGGGLQALGDAKELDAQTLKDAALSTAGGAAFGAVGGAAGKLIGKGLGAIGSRIEGAAARGVRGAEQQIEARAIGEAAKRTASAMGTAGAAVQKGNRLVENLQRLVATGDATEEHLAALKALEESGTVKELNQKLLGRALEDLPSAAREAETARALAQTAKDTEGEYAQQLAKQYGSLDEAKAQVAARVKRYAPRAAMAAGGALLGEATGEDHGGALGGAAGLSVGFAGGPALHAIKRMMLNPAVRKTVYGSIGKVGKALVADPGRLGKYGAILASAAARGSDALNAAHFTLSQTDPGYQRVVKDLDGDGLPDNE